MKVNPLDKFIPFIGIEYAPNARQDNLVDCWGLVILVYEKVYNIDLPTFEYNGLSKDGISNTSKLILDNPLHGLCSSVDSLEHLQEGDILIISNGGNPTHIGMAINNKQMIHAFDKAGSTIEIIRSKKWQKRIVSIHRHPHFS